MKQSVFRLENVSYSYPQGEPVLRGLSFEISKGERVSVLGANGCGKSTLLKMLAGLIVPREGGFTAFGRPVGPGGAGMDLREYHRRVGFIFQDSEVQLFCSTVYEELAFGPLQLGMDREALKKRIGELARMLGIESLLKKAPFRLSGGEKKKVAIGSVLVLNPDVLILDEPTNSLDPRSQTWLLNLLRTLGEAGKTLIFATHNLALVPEVSDRAILFDEDHTVAADGPVGEILKDAGLLKRVNLVDGRFRGIFL